MRLYPERIPDSSAARGCEACLRNTKFLLYEYSTSRSYSGATLGAMILELEYNSRIHPRCNRELEICFSSATMHA